MMRVLFVCLWSVAESLLIKRRILSHLSSIAMYSRALSKDIRLFCNIFERIAEGISDSFSSLSASRARESIVS